MKESKIMLGDCRELLQTIPDKQINGCIITDMPYPSLEKHRAIGTTTRLKESNASSNPWFNVISYDDMLPLALQFYRILENNTYCYSFTDFASLDIMKHQFEKAGFESKQLLVWDKVYVGMGYHWRNQCEYILMFAKGNRQLNDLAKTNLLRYARVANALPAEKPLALYTEIIRNSTNIGEIVCDPFMGCAANIIRACCMLNRQYIGMEINQNYFERCQRVEQRYREEYCLNKC